MLKKLKKKNITNNIVLALLLLAIATGVLFINQFSIFKLIAGPTNIVTVPLDKLEGSYVQADLDAILDAYAEETTTKNGSTRTSKVEYLIPIGPVLNADNWMGLVVKSSRVEEADDLMHETWDYQDGTAGSLGTPVTFRGIVRAMTSEEEDYFWETVDQYSVSHDIFLPLVIEDGSVGGYNTWVYSIIAIVLVGIAVLLLVRAFTGYYQRDLVAMYNSSANPEGTKEEIERFYEETPEVNGIRFNRDWVMFTENGTTRLLHAQEIAWVYCSTVKHRTNGIPTGNSFSLTLRTLGGKKYDIGMRTQQKTQETRDAMFDLLPQAVFGYDAAYEQMFNSNPSKMRQLADKQHNITREAPAPASAQAAPEEVAVTSDAMPESAPADSNEMPAAPAEDSTDEPSANTHKRRRDIIADAAAEIAESLPEDEK